ncbi:tRNA Adenine-N1--methyltransferase [Trichophyton interdigitale]|uniref:tRNA (adenine(58)-N(1))-methyltransferase catalytic subunit TRM61 n=1 Tax=Trichophyton interdigitale TaxID=101480 RepID=A0A9P5CYQ5_9EURO|nr:tRNA Adenine-N1--methyltransferase [Trichophyton interdigitale]KAF3897918.1 tRNA Adenine-N1--methyltransferase [Trichophyton interdigitale]KAG8210206.1 tRNA Adenine-N1--methyltransferase [Trichophyton interdigitale]
MASVANLSRRLFTTSRSPLLSHARPIDTNFGIFQEGDRVILNTTKGVTLTKPLKKDQKIDVRGGYIEHNHIIGKGARDIVRTHNGRGDFRITQPTLDEYVSLTRRLVTPVYAADASLIVSLLDIHTPPPSGDEQHGEPLEILEAGTGHGSLTLHLARAINGANTCPPPIPQATQRTILDPQCQAQDTAEVTEEENIKQKDWDSWRAKRNAILHTVEISPKVSAHAEKVVRGFRRGIYTGSVDFYVSSAESWIQHQIESRSSKLPPGEKLKPFLSYALLDMPSAEKRIPEVARVLKTDGVLAIFTPSITQIGDCVQLIKDQHLPLVLTKSVELGMGISGGRLWDVRPAVIRASMKSQDDAEEAMDSPADTSVANRQTHSAKEEDTGIQSSQESGLGGENHLQSVKHVMVCRPKVGERIVGGGFVGIWRIGKV